MANMVSEPGETTIHQVIPIFNGEAYGFWKIKMKTYLKTRKLWTVVEEGVSAEPTPGDHSPDTVLLRTRWEEACTKDMMALQILQTAVSDAIFPRIAPASSAEEAWKALEMEFQGSSQVRMINLQTLRREYENLKMEESGSINDFTTKLVNLSNQLRIHGEEKTDYLLVQKILISLPEKFDSIVAVLEQTRDLSTVSVTDIVGTLKAHEKRLSLREERTNEGAFYGEKFVSKGGNKQKHKRHEKTKKWCGVCKKDNHNEVDCWKKKNRNNSQMSVKNERKCYVCDKPGHIAKDCRLKRNDRAYLSLEETEEETEGRHMLFSAIAEEESAKVSDETWLIDSGCTNHMSNEESYFINLDRSKKTNIKVGNGQLIMSEGMGDIQVPTNRGIHTIREVLLVPSLARNLLSVSQMISNGYRVTFEDDKCNIQDAKGMKILEIKMRNKSFPIKWKPVKEETHMAGTEKEEKSDLWHRRLGHVSHDKIEMMQREKSVEDFPKFSVSKNVCKACEMGKQSRRSFPKKSQSKTCNVLDLIHSDVCGPMQTESMNGSRYFLTFIDDYSRMIWVYFMKNKSEVLTRFKIFKSYVENQSGNHIKRIRSDGGGEYFSKEFNKLCQEDGIKHEVTTPYSPQQNGIAERRNRSLMEMARTMLKEKYLPNQFWAEAVATSVYLQNRVPTKALEKGVTPLEVWSRSKPSVKHLKTFGCVCYVHIPVEKRRKLDDKAKEGIFIGYSNESKGYRIYLLEDKKVEVSRDVIFDEDKTWNWEKKEVKTVMISPFKIKDIEILNTLEE